MQRQPESLKGRTVVYQLSGDTDLFEGKVVEITGDHIKISRTTNRYRVLKGMSTGGGSVEYVEDVSWYSRHAVHIREVLD